MRHVIDKLVAMGQHWLHGWTTPERLGAIAVLAVGMLLFELAQRRRRGTWAPLGRDFRTDVMYWLFYSAGVFTLLGGAHVFTGTQAAIHRWLPAVELNLVRDKAPWIQFLSMVIACDFASYWWHRWTHASPLLWLVHRPHHSQTQLTPFTNYRVHFVDMIGRGLFLLIPGTILGANAQAFIFAIIGQTALNTLAHADLDWSYGPFRRLVVSPQYHRVHHAEDEAMSNHNFGVLLSVWDFLFGTTAIETARPEQFGVAEPVPSGFIAQQFDPFVAAFRRARAFLTRSASAPPIASAAPSELEP